MKVGYNLQTEPTIHLTIRGKDVGGRRGGGRVGAPRLFTTGVRVFNFTKFNKTHAIKYTK